MRGFLFHLVTRLLICTAENERVAWLSLYTPPHKFSTANFLLQICESCTSVLIWNASDLLDIPSPITMFWYDCEVANTVYCNKFHCHLNGSRLVQA